MFDRKKSRTSVPYQKEKLRKIKLISMLYIKLFSWLNEWPTDWLTDRLADWWSTTAEKAVILTVLTLWNEGAR